MCVCVCVCVCVHYAEFHHQAVLAESSCMLECVCVYVFED